MSNIFSLFEYSMIFIFKLINSLVAMEKNSSFGFLGWACVLEKNQMCYLCCWLLKYETQLII